MTATNPTPEEQRAVFFKTIMDVLPNQTCIHIWQPLDDGTDWVFTAEEAEVAVSRNGRHDVYLGLGTQDYPGDSNERTKAQTITGTLGLLADIDIKDDKAHKAQALPETKEEALAFLLSLPIPPTFIIDSGHGLHAWWLFNEAWMFREDTDDRIQAMKLSYGWQRYIREQAAERHGWKLDSVGDLARVLRVPGTLNAKIRKNVKPVKLERNTGLRYNPQDFNPYASSDYKPPRGNGTFDDTRRFRRDDPCPICGGYQELPQGIQERCWGYWMQDETAVYCMRQEFAGGIKPREVCGSDGYLHRLNGRRCPCGKVHPNPKAKNGSKGESKNSQNSTTEKTKRQLLLTPMIAIDPKKTEWLFQGYIPRGEVSVLAGAGGGGKTSSGMSVVVSKAGGLSLPMGAHSDVTEPMGVIYLTNENDPAKVLRPRLEAEALKQTVGDREKTKEILGRIFVQQGVVTLPDGNPIGEDLQEVAENKDALVIPQDIGLLRDAIRANNVGLVVIDPVISFSERELDVLNPKDMRELLDPLAVLAQQEGIAVWVFVHFNKSVGTDVIMRISLSRQLTDTARAVGAVLEDPDGSGRRWLSFVKGNLGVDPPSYSFYVDEVSHPNFPGMLSAAVTWEDSREGKADRLERELAKAWEKVQSDAESKDPLSPKVLEKLQGQAPATYDAVMALVQEMVALKQSGAESVHSHNLEDWRVARGFNKDPWTRARHHLHIQTKKMGNGNAVFEQRLDDPELAWLEVACSSEPIRAEYDEISGVS